MSIQIQPLPTLTNENTSQNCCRGTARLTLENETALDLASATKALGHPVRLQMVGLLSRYGGELCVCEIEGCFDLSQPTISHHLRVLHKAGWIQRESRGLWAYYSVSQKAVSLLNDISTVIGVSKYKAAA